MKLKLLLLPLAGMFLVILSLLLFLMLIASDENDAGDFTGSYSGGVRVSEEVEAYRTTVERYAEEYGISEYVNVLLAIMEEESGGRGTDVMQASESLGLSPNTLDTESSIRQGCRYFAELMKEADEKDCDLNTVIQSYNYGGGFLAYAASRGKKYTFSLAENFAREKSGGKTVRYSNEIAVQKNGGWRYAYGNMFYVPIVTRHFLSTGFSDETVQTVMDEALKFQGWTYVYGGDHPSTSFDCSGLVQWCYRKAGISLPRTAQEQYDATEHLPLSQAQPGDLVFFTGTYNAGTYITHVGIYQGNNRM